MRHNVLQYRKKIWLLNVEAYAQKAQAFEQDFSRRQAEEPYKILMKRIRHAVDAAAKKEVM